MANAGRVVPKAQILDHVWRYDFGGDPSIVDTYISYLRRKVDTAEPKLIHTVHGVGYVLRRPGREAALSLRARLLLITSRRCWPSGWSVSDVVVLRRAARPPGRSGSTAAAHRSPSRSPGSPPRAGHRAGAQPDAGRLDLIGELRPDLPTAVAGPLGLVTRRPGASA